MVERIERAGAHGDKGLPEKNELDDFHRTRWAARGLARHRRDASNARVGKNRCVERAGLLSLLGIPKERRDLLQGIPPVGIRTEISVSRLSALWIAKHRLECAAPLS